MDFVTIFVIGLTVLAFVLAGVGAVLYQVGQDESAEAHIKSRIGLKSTEEIEEEHLASLIRDEAEDNLRDALGSVGDTIRITLQQADSSQTVSEFVIQSAAIGLIASLLMIVYMGPSTFFVGFGAAYVPWALLKRAANQRSRSMLDLLPDALELMGRAMQSGAGLSDAFSLVQKEMPDPVSSDFGRVYDSVRFGKDWRDALSELIERNPSLFDLRLFASALILQRETGGNTIETVNRIAKMIRQRMVFDAKVKAMSAEARMSGSVLAFMPVGVGTLLYIASPEYMSPLWTTTLGQMLSVTCVFAYGIGIVVMRAVSSIKA